MSAEVQCCRLYNHWTKGDQHYLRGSLQLPPCGQMHTRATERAGWPAETQQAVIRDLPSASNLLIGSVHFVCHSALSLVQPNSVVWLIHRTLCYLSSLKLSISLPKLGHNLREFVPHPQRGYTKLNLKVKNYNGRLCTKYNLLVWPMRIFLTGFCLMSNQHEFKLSQ